MRLRLAGAALRRTLSALVLLDLAAGAILVGIIVVGLTGSPGNQPGQLQPLPSPTTTFGLMPMGNAHIPTTNACLLCHGAAGEVKTVPSILHPVEGWRRCVVCHTNADLGRTAPGHEGIAEEECLNCHKSAPTGPAITRPHALLQNQRCLDCHGGVAHLPSSMASSREEDCVLCHKPTDLPPPVFPHARDPRLSCRSCHQSAEAGALPIDHALRSDETCLLCHDIRVEGAGAPASPSAGTWPLPARSPLPAGSPGASP